MLRHGDSEHVAAAIPLTQGGITFDVMLCLTAVRALQQRGHPGPDGRSAAAGNAASWMMSMETRQNLQS